MNDDCDDLSKLPRAMAGASSPRSYLSLLISVRRGHLSLIKRPPPDLR
jgi:hypothetical protein